MACPFCVYSLERNFEKIKEVKDILIDAPEGTISFNIPKEDPPEEKYLKDLVKKVGFAPSRIK